MISFRLLNLFDYLRCMKKCPFSDSACVLSQYTDNFMMNGICARGYKSVGIIVNTE